MIGPRGRVPEGELIGLRLVDGVAEVSVVELDDERRRRGDVLAHRLTTMSSGRVSWRRREDEVARPLLALVHGDDDLLREPLPPLSEICLATAPAPWDLRPTMPPAHVSMRTFVPDWVGRSLEDAAALVGLPVEIWLGRELARLASWPERWSAPPVADDDVRAVQHDGGVPHLRLYTEADIVSVTLLHACR